MSTLDSLRDRYAALSAREQRIVAIGGGLALVLLLLAVVMPLYRSVSTTATRVERKRADLAWMQQVGPVIASAGPAATVPANQESLLLVVDRVARESGLGTALTGSQPNGNGGLRVDLQKASFDSVVAWLARLAEQNGVRVVSATLDSSGEPGLVNAGVVLQTR